MNETVITVVGNVANDPRLRVTTNGTRVVSFRLASTERRYDRALGNWRDGDTIFYTVTCWRNAAENLIDSVQKGQPLLVHGRLRDASYEKEGHQHTVFEIEAYALGHDISRGVSAFTKATQVAARRDFILDDGEQPGVPAVGLMGALGALSAAGGAAAGAADAGGARADGEEVYGEVADIEGEDGEGEDGEGEDTEDAAAEVVPSSAA